MSIQELSSQISTLNSDEFAELSQIPNTHISRLRDDRDRLHGEVEQYEKKLQEMARTLVELEGKVASLKLVQDGERNEIRKYVEGNGFQWQDDRSTAFNATTAIGWLGGALETAKKAAEDLERSLEARTL